MGTAEKRKRLVRCLNCFERIEIPSAARRHACPKCGYVWRVSWHPDGMAKIRGPVWSDFRRRASAAKSGK